jgi:hypothetical protein
MLRRLVCSAALTVFVAAGAHAQFQANLTFGYNGDPVDYAGYYGTFNGTGADNALTGRIDGTAFQLFCADEFHYAYSGDAYDVWVTPISSTDFSHTREWITFGNHSNSADQALYFNAAALASSMTQVTSPPSANGSSDNGTNANLQFAIWNTLGYPGTPPCSAAGTPAGGCLQNQDPHNYYDPSDVSGDEAAYTPALTGISSNQWLVITAFDLQTNNWQEFLYNGPGRPFSTPVPEPGTMAMVAMGLVGMAGAGYRRRKKK